VDVKHRSQGNSAGTSDVVGCMAYTSTPCCNCWVSSPSPPLKVLLYLGHLQYYFSPAGKRYRSRQEIARDFGLVEDKTSGRSSKKAAPARQPLSRDEAASAAAARHALLALPAALPDGITVHT
jgi:hypothetical protein